jgi:hypothetical protein
MVINSDGEPNMSAIENQLNNILLENKDKYLFIT